MCTYHCLELFLKIQNDFASYNRVKDMIYSKSDSKTTYSIMVVLYVFFSRHNFKVKNWSF